jgi:hypothetical protein
MLRLLLIALGLMSFAEPSWACSPPGQTAERPANELAHLAATEIRASKVILDALVTYRGETIFLKPLRVWKGKHQKLYEVAGENYCGGAALAVGSKVRVLLTKLFPSEKGWFVIRPLEDRNSRSVVFDRAVDAYVGHVRPSGFENGAPPHFPLPKHH